MKTILNSAEFIHIPEYSVYCYNFYRNTINGKIILEECDDEKITQFISDLYVEINLYNITHASTPIVFEYNYALNSNENTKKLTELFTIVYRKLEEMALS